MASGQQFLFAPERPLVKRLGKRFFKKIPKRPGVYKMRDAQDNIVYVGKAKDLRQRLQSDRVANPERMGRRHLRLLQQVTRIEFDLCPNETVGGVVKTERHKFHRSSFSTPSNINNTFKYGCVCGNFLWQLRALIL